MAPRHFYPDEFWFRLKFGCALAAINELVACFGELLIDFVPTVGGLSLADAPAFKKAPGGAPANVACGIAKLGGKAAFIGKVCHLLSGGFEMSS